MSHVIPLSAVDIADRLSKIPDMGLDIFCTGTQEVVNNVSCLVVNIPHDITNGLEMKIKPLVSSADVEKLCVRKQGTNIQKMFDFVDAGHNNLGQQGVFSDESVVKVILELYTTSTESSNADGCAFILNPVTNAYLETRLYVQDLRTSTLETKLRDIHVGQNVPDNTVGQDGDIYVVYQ